MVMHAAGRRIAMSSMVALLGFLSLLAALATGAGVYVYAAFTAENFDGIGVIWLAWMIAAFSVSVANAIWSAKQLKAPTWRGVAPILGTSLMAVLSFAVLKAATT